MKEKLALIIALTVLIGVCFSVYFFFEGRYALSEELKKVQQRLDYKILSDQFQSISERIWKIKDRKGENPKDETVKEELRQLEMYKESIKVKIDVMEKKGSDTK